jgi:hypothetical protein
MPTPKLATSKGRKVPEWNLSPAELKEAQQTFREELAASTAAKSKKPAAKQNKAKRVRKKT